MASLLAIAKTRRLLFSDAEGDLPFWSGFFGVWEKSKSPQHLKVIQSQGGRERKKVTQLESKSYE